MKKNKISVNYLEELEELERQDREVFLKLKAVKEIHCDVFDKICLFVTERDDQCFKKCKYYKKTIKPLEKESLKLLVKIAEKQKEANDI